MTIRHFIIIAVCAAAAALLTPALCLAQGPVTIYPSRLYPTENIVTVTDPEGIERITATSTPKTVVTVPVIRGCPKSVDVKIVVNDPTSNESVNLTVYDCKGAFTTQTLLAEAWNIIRRRVGPVAVGSDTCIMCEISTTDDKRVDSITCDNQDITIEMPPPKDGPWDVFGGITFYYNVCYRPRKPERSVVNIKLYVHRGLANGGLTQYVIDKPVNITGVPAPKPVERAPADTLPQVTDPTTFRNIVMPSARSLGKNKFFVSNYEVVGWLLGYGLTDRLTVFGGGVFVPDFISRVLVGTLGAKYELVSYGDFRAALGGVYALSSTVSSDIRTASLFGALSYGNDQRRLTLAGGYAWKHHTLSTSQFDRNAVVAALGGDLTIARGWKIAAESYYIQSSDISPLVVTARYFTNSFAFDFGFGINLAGGNSITSTGGLSGRIDKLSLAPMLSATWVW